jgi:hypothetical protein
MDAYVGNGDVGGLADWCSRKATGSKVEVSGTAWVIIASIDQTEVIHGFHLLYKIARHSMMPAPTFEVKLRAHPCFFYRS